MNSNFIKRKGFSLIELLIASSIFAIIMVIVVSTFSWAAGYNNKLKETRKTAQNGRMIMSEISTQVRLANGSVKYYISSPTTSVMGEVVLLNCTGSLLTSCSPVGTAQPARYNSDTITEAGFDSVSLPNAVLILKKDLDKNNAILYRSVASGTNYNFTKQEATINDFADILATLTSPFSSVAPQILNDPSISARVFFGGYGPTGADLSGLYANKKQQPFVEFYLVSKSANYDTLMPNNRSKFEAKSLVETRYYN